MGWLSDLGDAASSAAGAVGDAVEGAVSTVAEGIGDVIDSAFDGVQSWVGWLNNWLCARAGSIGCRAGNIVLGGISGVLEGLQDLVDKNVDLVIHIGAFAGAVLRGDIAGAIGELGNIVIDVVELFVNWTRFVMLGTVFGGIRDAWEAEDLRVFVKGLVASTFAGDPERLRRIGSQLRLDEADWGFTLKATHRVMYLDSGNVPLWQWHQEGKIDLYAMAGLASADSFNVRRRRTAVYSTNAAGDIISGIPINRWKLGHYIESNGKENRFRVYALSRRAIADFVQVASDKFKKLGIKLSWNEGERFDYFGDTAVHEITTYEEFNFNRLFLGSYLEEQGLRTPPHSQCNMLALGAFQFVKGRGQCSGRDITEGDEVISCGTPGRTDSCCIGVDAGTAAGVMYHDEWPPAISRYVVAHEGGHYVGLCHYGHDGFQNIMFTDSDQIELSYLDWGLFNFYLDNEPRFSLEDAKNVWRFLVTELVPCLDPKGEG